MPLPRPSNKVVEEIVAKYGQHSSTPAQLQFLLYGPSGSGKTYSLRTAKKPLWIDSFDPGGANALGDLVASGDATIITAYEDEDAKKPSAFELWDRNFEALIRANAFANVGTYALDSATTWSQAILNFVLKKAARAGGVPQQNDWYPQMNLMEAAIKKIMSLPCDIVFICHDDILKDEITGKVTRSPMLTGKSKKRIPLLFSEVYYVDVKRSSKGSEYVWQTKKDSTNEARSRMAGLPNVKVEEYEPQHFGLLMKKVGRPYDDVKSVQNSDAPFNNPTGEVDSVPF